MRTRSRVIAVMAAALALAGGCGDDGPGAAGPEALGPLLRGWNIPVDDPTQLRVDAARERVYVVREAARDGRRVDVVVEARQLDDGALVWSHERGGGPGGVQGLGLLPDGDLVIAHTIEEGFGLPSCAIDALDDDGDRRLAFFPDEVCDQLVVAGDQVVVRMEQAGATSLRRIAGGDGEALEVESAASCAVISTLAGTAEALWVAGAAGATCATGSAAAWIARVEPASGATTDELTFDAGRRVVALDAVEGGFLAAIIDPAETGGELRRIGADGALLASRALDAAPREVVSVRGQEACTVGDGLTCYEVDSAGFAIVGEIADGRDLAAAPSGAVVAGDGWVARYGGQ